MLLVRTGPAIINYERLKEEFNNNGNLVGELILAGYSRNNAREWTWSGYTIPFKTIWPNSNNETYVQPGDVHLNVQDSLTSTEINTIESILNAHNYTLLSTDQTQEDKDTAEFQEMITRYAEIRDNWDVYTNAQKLVLIQRALNLMLRYIIRKERKMVV